MKNFNDTWKSFLTEGGFSGQQPLHEVSEDELEHIITAIDLRPEDLAFNHLFKNKKRLVIEFPTINTSSDLGQFMQLWDDMGYEVDWEKGIVSAVKEAPLDFEAEADEILRGDAEWFWLPSETKMRKIKMKIGKFFSKIYAMTEKYNAINAKIVAEEGDDHVTIGDEEKVLGKKEWDRYDNLRNQLRMYIGPTKYNTGVLTLSKIKELAEYWQLKADWIKKNLHTATNNDYSIIITRDPIDVWRMADFDNISSCHSPPSRSGQVGEYYKCALAEAHGHGAVAYVVKTQELAELLRDEGAIERFDLSEPANEIVAIENWDSAKKAEWYWNYGDVYGADPADRENTREKQALLQQAATKLGVTPETLEQYVNNFLTKKDRWEGIVSEEEYNMALANYEELKKTQRDISALDDEEIFHDDARGYLNNVDGLEPVSRVRLRQLRYWDTEDDIAPAGHVDFSASTELAVGERRVYGSRIPGLTERIEEWLIKNQEQAMESVPKKDGKINLDAFVAFGGSHADTTIRTMITNLFDVGSTDVVGYVSQDNETEESLDANLAIGLDVRWDNECEEIATRWNNLYAICKIDYEVEDDGGGGVYIGISAGLEISWEMDEWNSLPNPIAGSDAADYLNDLGLGYIDDSGASIHKRIIWPAGTPREKRQETIVFVCNINIEGLPTFGGQAVAYDPEMFDDFGQAVNEDVDDRRDMLQAVLTQYFKQQGYISGSPLYTLGHEIDNGEIDSYEWDLTATEDYEDDYDFISATCSVWVDPYDEEIEIRPSILENILNSRDYNILVRSKIHKMGTTEEHFVNSKTIVDRTTNVDQPEFLVKHTMELHYNSSKPQVQAFRQIVDNVDDEDELKAIFMSSLKEILNARLPAAIQQPSVNESKYLVNTWKEFLKG